MTCSARMLRLAAVLVGLALAPVAAPQSLQAATSPAPDLKVVVRWPASAGAASFQLYRRAASAATFPATPLNAAPLAPLTSCPAIKAVIPEGSPDWVAVEEGLATGQVKFNPCDLATVAPADARAVRLELLIQTRWRIAVVMGRAFEDRAVSAGVAYQYQARARDAAGVETPLAGLVTVTAGVPAPLVAPAGLVAQAGDGRVLLTWQEVAGAAGYTVWRATAPGGPFQQVNDAGMTSHVTKDVNDAPMPAPKLGFLDLQRYDASGHPTTHLVGGVAVAGPANGTTYHYAISSADLLGQEGARGAPVAATPRDRTPPAAPTNVMVTALAGPPRLQVRWSRVELDVDGRVEQVASYQVYRYEEGGDPAAPSVAVGPPVVLGGALTGEVTDASAALSPPYGEKVFYYRVDALDASGNRGGRSASASGKLPDTTPPGPVKGLGAKGQPASIDLDWAANPEPDLDSYQVYRTLCDMGKPVPCTDKQPRPEVGFLQPTCSGPFQLVGTVTRASAAPPDPKFVDKTVPADSPLCYAYWVKALDKAQNRGGAWPWPGAAEKTVCQRLRDRTPPGAAVIVGLDARDGALRVQWVGAPVQDVKAYHVYRADTEAGPYRFVGGMTVPPAGSSPTELTAPYVPPATAGCDTIPLVAVEGMAAGSFEDRHVEPHQVYWYKVVGIDQVGNEGALADAVPVSSFTFTAQQPAAPSGVTVTKVAAPVGLAVRWAPTFDPARHVGFAVFRATAAGGLFRQIESVVAGNELVDQQVVRGQAYWYRVLLVDRLGHLSQLTPAVQASP